MLVVIFFVIAAFWLRGNVIKLKEYNEAASQVAENYKAFSEEVDKVLDGEEVEFFPLLAHYNMATDGLETLFPQVGLASKEESLPFPDTRLNKNGLPQILYDLRDNLAILYKGCVTDRIVEQLSLQK